MTLEQIKNNLRVDHDFDDDYLEMLHLGAISIVLSSLEISEAPQSNQKFDIAVQFIIANWYENRVGFSNNGAGMTQIPYGVMAIIHQLRGELKDGVSTNV